MRKNDVSADKLLVTTESRWEKTLQSLMKVINSGCWDIVSKLPEAMLFWMAIIA